MRKSKSPVLFPAIASFLGIAILVSAHEEKTLLTDMFCNERTGNLEIAHRINLHDAEHVLRRTDREFDDLLHSETAQSLFSKYVETQFFLKKTDGSELELLLVGQEIDQGYFWVYQEIPLTKLPEKAFTISHSILHEEVKQQTNTVNVRFGEMVRTFVFTSGTEAKLFVRPKD